MHDRVIFGLILLLLPAKRLLLRQGDGRPFFRSARLFGNIEIYTADDQQYGDESGDDDNTRPNAALAALFKKRFVLQNQADFRSIRRIVRQHGYSLVFVTLSQNITPFSSFAISSLCNNSQRIPIQNGICYNLFIACFRFRRGSVKAFIKKTEHRPLWL